MAAQTYLTPTRFASGGYGIDTGTMTQAAIRNTLMRASSIVDTYCNGPMYPSRYDFRGGSVADEQHEWPYVEPLLQTANNRRVYLNANPIRTVTSFKVRLSTNYTITLDPSNNLYVNGLSGYVEVVALTPTITGFWPGGWPLGLYTPVAEVSYTYGWRFPVVGDVCESESPTLYTASHGNWLFGGEVHVYVDGAEVDDSDYAISIDDGSITFAQSATPGIQETVTADYTYVLPDAISQATGLIATDLIGHSRIAARGMIGLSSIKVAEVSLTAMQTGTRYIEKNGMKIPTEAGLLLGPYVKGSAA